MKRIHVLNRRMDGSTISEDIAAFRFNRRDWLLSLFCAATGVFFVVAAHVGEEKPVGAYIAMCVMGALMFGGGLCFSAAMWRRMYLVASKRRGTLSYASRLGQRDNGKTVCRLSDIVAVQVCSQVTTDIGTLYELNVIANRKTDDRTNVAVNTNRDRLFHGAERFAEFLGVPLLDHSD